MLCALRRCGVTNRQTTLLLSRSAKMAANDVRVGNVLEMDGALLKVSKREHVKPGKGGAFVQLELKDIKSATKRNVRLRAADTVEKADFENPEPYRILYREKDVVSLMHEDTFDQIEIDAELVAAEQRDYLVDDTVIQIQSYEGKPLLVEVAKEMEFEIVAAEGELGGSKNEAVTRIVTLSNGVSLKVPGFVNTGDRIVVNTHDGEYMRRA